MRFSSAALPRAMFSALLLLLLAGCTNTHTTRVARGQDSWVFRSVLDWQARMVTVALRPGFWLAYHADDGALYKVWRDGVVFDGAVYTTKHGPQPMSQGPYWLQSELRAPWFVRDTAGRELPVAVQYRGHRFAGEEVVFSYDITLPGGQHATVQEQPVYLAGEQGLHGLERSFVVEGLPTGYVLGQRLHLNSLSAPQAYACDGQVEIVRSEQIFFPGGTGAMLEGNLLLRPDGLTRFTVWFTEQPGITPAIEAVREDHPALALIEGSDCKTCHNELVKTVGPSYLDIAKKYETTSANIVQLARKVIRGGAGVWGEQVMTAHPDLAFADASTIISYILTLDGEPPLAGTPKLEETYAMFRGKPSEQGLVVHAYAFEEGLDGMPTVTPQDTPVFSTRVPVIHAEGQDFAPLENNFYLRIEGYIDIPRTGNYVFRLASDDGSYLYIDEQEVINHDGFHGADAKDGEIQLTAGRHAIRVDYFEAGGGQALSLQWIAYGEADFAVIPASVLSSDAIALRDTRRFDVSEPGVARTPGDGAPLDGVHPSFAVETIRPESFHPKVGGLDLLPDGRVVLSTWDPEGSVWIVSNFDQPDRDKIQVKRIAKGLAEPLGLRVVDGEIYVLQKQELTHLIDHDGDEEIDEYRTVCNSWLVSSNFHEFAFGLAYQDEHFYFTLATAIQPGGASTQPQIPDRGKVARVSRTTGVLEFIAQGLRTPNGIGIGVGDQLYVADNQGDWLPSSKIVHVQPGAFFGSRSVDFAGTASLRETPPVVWLPQDEIGNSPSQPAALNVGPYQGQMIHGEVTHGGIKRVFVEEVGGAYQGCLFRFTQGLEAGVNRLVWGADGHLYIGGVGNPGNWSHTGRLHHGLQRMKYTGEPVFEMLAVRAQPDGFEIELTEPLAEGQGLSAADYGLHQWRYVPTVNYGGPKVDETVLAVRKVEVSPDRRRVRLTVGGLKAGHVVYFRLNNALRSQTGRALWSTEAWYTLNRIPSAGALSASHAAVLTVAAVR